MLADEDVRAWLDISDREIKLFLKDLPQYCRMTPGRFVVSGVVKADPKDDKILAAAKEAGASYIVTEDGHLLDLGNWKGIKIMTREDFRAELDRLGVSELKKPPARWRPKK